MRAVVQRVRCARVRVAGETVAEMGSGLLALVGVARDDGPGDAERLGRKLAQGRVERDAGVEQQRQPLGEEHAVANP